MKIGISGYYGMSNYGDDLFIASVIWGATSYWSEFQLNILSNKVDNFKVNYSTLPLINNNILSSKKIIGKVSRSINISINTLLMDKIIFAGGSLFSSANFNSKSMALLLKRNNKKYFSAIGVSVGPFDRIEDEKKIKKQLQNFEFISVRDKISYERILNFGLNGKIKLSADLAGLIPYLIKEKSDSVFNKNLDSEVFRIGFSPCYLNNRADESLRYCDEFIKFAQKLNKKNKIKVYLYNLNYLEDGILIEYLKQKLLNDLINVETISNEYYSTLDIWDSISNLSCMFSVRLHGAITAYLTEIPFFHFEYHEKCTEFLDYIGKPLEERIVRKDWKDADYNFAFQNSFNSTNKKLMNVKTYSKLSEINFIEAPF